MELFIEILRTVVVPIIIGLSTIYMKVYLDLKKEKRHKKDEMLNKINVLEAQYYELLTHHRTLSLLVEESKGISDYKRCKMEAEDILELLIQVEITYFSSELKNSWSILIHGFKVRIMELESILNNEYNDEKKHHFHLQIFGFVQLLGNECLNPMKIYIDETRESIQD